MESLIKRTELHEKLPLRTPFSVHMFVSYFCNFKCNYCLHSLSDKQLKEKKFQKQFMDFDLYKKAIDDIAAFDDKLKALIFAGHGEPLLHKDIAKMVEYAKKKEIADRIEIVTNGSLLTKKMSDELIAAGLDRLRISVQGITDNKYREVTGKMINFDEFIDNIRYFYQHKKKTQIYCKIIDIALEHDAGQENFYQIFQPIADEVAVEYAIPFVQELDYSKLKNDFEQSKQGNQVSKSNICSMPFYMLVVTPNGDMVPCCSTDVPLIYGNVKEKSLKTIWHSAITKGFCRLQLLGNRNKHPICSLCSVPQYGLQNGDYLDDHTEELLKKYHIE
jgi:radical SAM protein with 4Fe4S-binding SPASM domain